MFRRRSPEDFEALGVDFQRHLLNVDPEQLRRKDAGRGGPPAVQGRPEFVDSLGPPSTLERRTESAVIIFKRRAQAARERHGLPEQGAPRARVGADEDGSQGRTLPFGQVVIRAGEVVGPCPPDVVRAGAAHCSSLASSSVTTSSAPKSAG